jgi:magnesium-transporting ATPase (P-type)
MGVYDLKFSWNTVLEIFSGSTLAISCGFLGLLIYKSLVNEEPKLPNEDEREEMAQFAIISIIFAIISFAIFGLIMFCDLYSSYNNAPEIQEAGTFFKQILLLPAFGLVVASHYIPRTFSLRRGYDD